MKSGMQITELDVTIFLTKLYDQEVDKIRLLSGGKHSLAFAYTKDSEKLVIRFNESKRGFLKDKYAYENFNQKDLPIPKIYTIGNYLDDTYFCISEMIEGETPKDQYKNGEFSSLQIQFETIEKIKDIPIPNEHSGYGELEIGGKTKFLTNEDYLMNMYTSKELFDWDMLRKLPYVDQDFIDHLVSKVKLLSKYSSEIRETLHGDFGNDNIFIKDGKVSGIIDWERLRFADHFLDVGRVILFCPNREETVSAALRFYENKSYEHYKERIALGVYYAMLRNYGAAAQSGNETSCNSSRKRIAQFEKLMEM